MWIWRQSDGTPYEFKPSLDTPTKCPLCGQYFKKDEQCAVVVPPQQFRKYGKLLKANFMVHLSEWNYYTKGVTDEDELFHRVLNIKIPRKNAFTPDEQLRVRAFVGACNEMGFPKETAKPYGVKMSKNGTSLSLEYNVYTDHIILRTRCKPSLFDGFFKREVVANAYTKMHNILGDGKKDDFTAAEALSKVAKDVNDIMSKIT